MRFVPLKKITSILYTACFLLIPVHLFSAQTSDTIILSPSLEKKSITLGLEPDTLVKLWLPTQMGTGYSWSTARPEIKSKLLKDTVDDLLTGGLEIQEFVIPAVKENSEFLFIYKRPWEEQSANEKSFTLKLKLNK